MSVVTLADVKTHLNITVATYDAELQTFIDAAEAAITKKVGPLASVAVTSRVDGYGCELVLPMTPVISVTSVTPNTGGPLVVADLTADPASGVVLYTVGNNNFVAPWYTVVYQAGRATPPADLLLAVKELVRSLWTSQRGAGTRPGVPAETQGPGYLMPYRVLELLGPYMRPGFA